MTTQNPTPPRGTPRVMLTAEQAADALGIGRTSTFALIKSGELRSLLIGRLRRVPADAITDYVNRHTATQRTADATEGN
jgi:excisionase family DNA binding protein